MAWPSIVLSQDAQVPASIEGTVIRVPKAEGIGNTEQEALNAAFESAVKEAVGVYIRVEKQLSSANRDLVKEISTLSNGYISWYEKTNLPDSPDGKKRVLITAEVSRDRMEIQLAKKEVWTRTEEGDSSAPVGGRNLNAKILSEQKRDADAANLLATWVRQSPTYSDMFLGVEIADVPDQPVKVADLPNIRGRGHSKEYEYPVRCRIHFDPTSVVHFGVWLDRAMQHVSMGKRAEFTYLCSAKIGNENGSKGVAEAFDNSHQLVIEPPQWSIFDSRRQMAEHPLHTLPQNQSTFVILTGLEWKAGGQVGLKWAVWTLPRSVINSFVQKIQKLSDIGRCGTTAGAYGIDLKKVIISESEGSPYFPKRPCLKEEIDSIAVYSPLGSFRSGFTFPYKEVLRVGSTFAELALINDVTVSLLECDDKPKENNDNYSQVKNRVQTPPEDQETFLQKFDFETSAKAINRIKTNLAPNRRTDRSGVTQAWATLVALEKGEMKPMANQTIRVSIQHPGRQPEPFGTYKTDNTGKIQFTEPFGKTLRPVTKLFFEFAGDDDYRDTLAEMGIR